ncbi:MAG: hypothetical protein AAF961_02285, partial [Planctomycetota bacterium]
QLARLRIWAHQRQIDAIHREEQYVVLAYANRSQIDRLRERSGGRVRIADSRSAYLPLDGQIDDAEAVLGELKSLLRPEPVTS